MREGKEESEMREGRVDREIEEERERERMKGKDCFPLWSSKQSRGTCGRQVLGCGCEM